MAYEFLGTYTKSQIDRYLAFARTQLPAIDARIQHLEAEMTRVGTVVFRYDNGKPLGFAGDPADSYLGKLLAAYEVLGGNPPRDLRVRLKNDPVFKLQGTEYNQPYAMSNGEVIPHRGKADAQSGALFRQAREWLDDTLHHRFGHLERKIRRAMDYRDQLDDELSNLQIIQSAANVEDSLEYVAAKIQGLISDPYYRVLFDDGGQDPDGLTAHAPFSNYDVPQGGPIDDNEDADREVEVPQRQDGGLALPGQTKV